MLDSGEDANMNVCGETRPASKPYATTDEGADVRLLIVEDEPKMCALLRDGLLGEGHLVTSAENGRDGLSLAMELDFDAIILDCMLPLLDGIEVARRLRRAGRMFPILMLTARDAVGDVVHGLDAGVDDYLTKPFALAELYARLRALSRRPTAIAPRVQRFADLELDLEGIRLRRGGRTVDLTRTEFRIIEYMMKRPDRVHRREAIIEAIWGYDCEVSNNTLDVFIKQLRNKIDDGYDVKRIVTVRGIGYRLQAAERC
jgi:DNA-binding response OmpR family regulator